MQKARAVYVLVISILNALRGAAAPLVEHQQEVDDVHDVVPVEVRRTGGRQGRAGAPVVQHADEVAFPDQAVAVGVGQAGRLAAVEDPVVVGVEGRRVEDTGPSPNARAPLTLNRTGRRWPLVSSLAIRKPSI